MATDLNCPTCESPEPRLHPATQSEGEVTHICPDDFHGPDLCQRCSGRPARGVCCSSHGKLLCHSCYRRTHFVELCVEGCSLCRDENLPVALKAAR